MTSEPYSFLWLPQQKPTDRHLNNHYDHRPPKCRKAHRDDCDWPANYDVRDHLATGNA